jgi:hypothetical protein
VVRYRRDSRKEVLESSDEKPISKRMSSALANPRIFLELRPHVVDPGRRVLVGVAELHSPEVIELEMVVSVHEAGENESPLDVDHEVGGLEGRVDSQDPTREPYAGGDAPGEGDPGVDQRYRAPPHEGFTS